MNQVLLIIDAQEALIEGENGQTPVYQKEQLITTINILIEQAEKNDTDVIFVRDLDVGGGSGDGFQVHHLIKVPEKSSKKMFNKLATNAFYETGLLNYLKERNIQHLIIAGCQTEYCIDTAVRYATVNGFDVTLIKDGHSTIDSAVLPAEKIIAHHNQTLHGHYNVDHSSVVRGSHEAVFIPPHNEYRKEWAVEQEQLK
ncbi:isochorismatase family protein [Cytobacillus kochii]|uniref:isochorismatase family protein n=1 Tax=Cytobacillus kochii TaxID=859143 RepID=UPI002781B266|nr:isochorismatase family protein [Cytobacillus kochii]MDQ0187667.1 nicotinamidase-related amidase [Cytobacillus kochii]